FFARFGQGQRDDQAAESLQHQLEETIDAVESLDEDRILRSFMAVVMAILRTSYFCDAGERDDRAERDKPGERDDKAERDKPGERDDRAERDKPGERYDRAERDEPGERDEGVEAPRRTQLA